MADVSLHVRVVFCFLIIFFVQDSLANVGMKYVLGAIVRDLYQNLPLGPANNDDTIIQERPSKEISLMQEIKSGRHGHGSNVHIYGRHGTGRGGRPQRDWGPQNIIDV